MARSTSPLTVLALPLALLACNDDTAGTSDTFATDTEPGLTTAETTGEETNSDSDTNTTPGDGDGDTTTATDTDSGDGDGDPAGGPCEASADCPAEQYCVEGMCLPGEGECETHDECNGDTYCCEAPDCLPIGEAPGICIPFGEGPYATFNPECATPVVIGLFEPDVQCEWLAPEEGDPFPGHVNVLTTPLVADLPFENPGRGEIVIVTYNFNDGGAEAGWGSNPAYYGVIRILDGDDCSLLQNVHDPAHLAVAASPPAIGDIDGDGIPEIVTQRAVTGLVAYHWDPNTQGYVTFWTSEGQSNLSAITRWDGPSLHDLDGDGVAEVISGSEVYDGPTGTRLNPGQLLAFPSPGAISIVGDIDKDFIPDLILDEVYTWDQGTDTWVYKAPGGDGGRHFAYADFGSPGLMPGEWNPDVFDEVAELVSVGAGYVSLHTLDGTLLFTTTDGGTIVGGGPPTIGDFDNDGRPEIASAGGTRYRVFDLDCDGQNPDCINQWVRWSQPSQDASSANTGSSIFDFEGDGEAEAVYGDECYLRVYEGASGEVLYSSARTSCTWYENPIVADPDQDQNTEILVGSNSNCNVGCPAIDPIHKGVRCEENEDCPSGSCDAGFCRCAGVDECPAEHECTAPILDTPGMGGNVCRATNPPNVALTGVRVLRDRLDRWASSRNMWNQHAYSITNVNDDLTIPDSANWALTQNFLDPELNNFRQNRQGDTPPDAQPDITGKLDEATCSIADGQTIMTGLVCNRGQKAVGSALPATFYLGDPAEGNILCVAYTEEPVPVEECREVSCAIDNEIMGTVVMVTNDDGMGGKTTVECFENNNSDMVEIEGCIPIE